MSKKTSKLKWIIIALVVALVLFLVGFCASLLLNGDTIADGVEASGVDLSGLTRVGASEALNEKLPKEIKNIKLEFLYEGEKIKLNSKELEPRILKSETIEEAFTYGKTGGIISRLKKLISAKLKGYNSGVSIDLSTDMLNEALKPVTDKIENPYVPVRYVVEPERLVIISGKRGRGVDSELIKKEISSRLFLGKSGAIKLEVVEREPDVFSAKKLHKIFACDMENSEFFKDTNGKIGATDGKMGIDFNIKTAQKIIDKAKGKDCSFPILTEMPEITADELLSDMYEDELASYSSRYSLANEGRVKNVELSISKLNGIELLPNEEFSYVNCVGGGTYEEGYVDAPVYADGGIENGVAGGICQGSSTLYAAVLFADLEVTERANHSMPVSYVPLGMDATIATPYIDFCFKNTSGHPLKIVASASGGVVSIRLVGKNDTPQKEVIITNKEIEKIEYETKEVETDELPTGEKRVKQNGSDGSVVETYKAIKQGGTVGEAVFVSKSRYDAIDKIVEIGK